MFFITTNINSIAIQNLGSLCVAFTLNISIVLNRLTKRFRYLCQVIILGTASNFIIFHVYCSPNYWFLLTLYASKSILYEFKITAYFLLNLCQF